MPRTVHIIGAGLAGLSAGVRLATSNNRVVVHEATAFAGGRCRSYHDASVGMTIDNGNHLLLSGNRAALDFLRMIGAAHRLIGPPVPEFPFLDLKSGARWTLRFDEGRLPFWIFDSARRVPGTRVLDYLSVARLLWPRLDKTVGETIACVPGTRRLESKIHSGKRPSLNRSVQRARLLRSRNGNSAAGGPIRRCAEPMVRKNWSAA